MNTLKEEDEIIDECRIDKPMAIDIIHNIVDDITKELHFSDEDSNTIRNAALKAIINTLAEEHFPGHNHKNKTFRAIASLALITRPEEYCIPTSKIECEYRNLAKDEEEYTCKEVTVRNIFTTDGKDTMKVDEWFDELARVVNYLFPDDYVDIVYIKVNHTYI